MSDRISHLPVSTHHDPDAARAAVQLVLRRAVAGQWTRREVLDVLEQLGLRGYDDGARVDNYGFRVSLTAAERRRRAAQEETA